MVELPETYSNYLAGLAPHLAEAIRPIFQQSAADGTRGVQVTLHPDEAHATVPDDVPFGEIRETIE